MKVFLVIVLLLTGSYGMMTTEFFWAVKLAESLLTKNKIKCENLPVQIQNKVKNTACTKLKSKSNIKSKSKSKSKGIDYWRLNDPG